jgi:hypothetical protein
MECFYSKKEQQGQKNESFGKVTELKEFSTLLQRLN